MSGPRTRKQAAREAAAGEHAPTSNGDSGANAQELLVKKDEFVENENIFAFWPNIIGKSCRNSSPR